MQKIIYFLVIPFVIILNWSCQSGDSDLKNRQSGLIHPRWSKNLSVYEVNIRQYSEQGTFRAFEKDLPRLKELGVGIICFLPLHPVGEINRKGTLGSVYAVKDYYTVADSYGTMEHFRNLVKKIHQMGMYVILDWVANQTSRDNELISAHADWYLKDMSQNRSASDNRWPDAIEFDYENADLRDYMLKTMTYWIIETGIDGYRCHMAEKIPLDFWEIARIRLSTIKPVLMLADGQNPRLHDRAFDASYNHNLFSVMNEITSGNKTVRALDTLLMDEVVNYSHTAYRMTYTSDHAINSNLGTVFERLGDGAAAFAVLTATIPGMQLIFNGQETGLNQRLRQFEKSHIPWQKHKFFELYKSLLYLKRNNEAIWNGTAGGPLLKIPTSDDESIFAFIRQNRNNRIFAILNLSATQKQITLYGQVFPGNYEDIFSGNKVSFKSDAAISLEPWEYRLYQGK
jgi:1,4-alpha-glucan branching enzyme